MAPEPPRIELEIAAEPARDAARVREPHAAAALAARPAREHLGRRRDAPTFVGDREHDAPRTRLDGHRHHSPARGERHRVQREVHEGVVEGLRRAHGGARGVPLDREGDPCVARRHREPRERLADHRVAVRGGRLRGHVRGPADGPFDRPASEVAGAACVRLDDSQGGPHFVTARGRALRLLDPTEEHRERVRHVVERPSDTRDGRRVGLWRLAAPVAIAHGRTVADFAR